MATVQELIDELVICDASSDFVAAAKDFVAANGSGLYNISTEYGNFEISRATEDSLEEVRNTIQSEIDEDGDGWDYFADFNTGSDARDGFLFGEGWFVVDIKA